MCGRYTLATPMDIIARHFGLDRVPAELAAPRYNIAPTQTVLAAREGEGGREAFGARFGLVPSWADSLAVGARMINARGETVAEKPAFRAAFRRRRCLLPADGYYEWQAAPGGKQPFHIRLAGGGLFAFAGLWESWTGPDGVPVASVAILTTGANALTAPIHERMPVIVLDPAERAAWLGADTPAADLGALIRPCPAEALEAVPVSSLVNRVATDDPRCIQPWRAGPAQSALF